MRQGLNHGLKVKPAHWLVLRWFTSKSASRKEQNVIRLIDNMAGIVGIITIHRIARCYQMGESYNSGIYYIHYSSTITIILFVGIGLVEGYLYYIFN